MILQRIKLRLLYLPVQLHSRKWSWLALKLCFFFLRLKPYHPELLNQLIHILADIGKIGLAIRFLRQSLKNAPNNPHLLSSLGHALLSCKRLEDAVTCFRKALAIKPNMIRTLVYLGNALTQLDRKQAAMDCYEKVIALKPDFPNGYHSMGLILLRDNQPNQAIPYLEKAIKLNPKMAIAHIHRGHAMTELGRFKEAEDALLKGLALEENSAGGYSSLSELQSKDRSNPHLSNMEMLLKKGLFSKADQTLMYFSLAKGYMSQGENELGFNYLQQGNKHKRASFHYEINKDASLFNRIVQSFDTTLFQERKGCGSTSQVPIFILGMPRSGTTLVEQILASHSQVYGAGEGLGLWHINSEMALLTKTRKGFPEGVVEIEQNSWQDLALAYEGGLREKATDALHITDKMPHNFLNIGLIHLLFSNAVIIHCRREPIDTCLSIYMQNFSGYHPYSYDLVELGEYYQLYHGLMNHWRDVLPNRMLEVQYEQMVEQPEQTAKQIIASCGLPWENSCLDFYKSSRAVHTASLVQVRQPIYKSAVGRWKKYETQLQPLIKALGRLAPGKKEEEQ
ncbi:MAG: sulfotransferase [Magnetococcales bacterium]|nr:sulfotransferase [Magnetococcales bacterium]